MFCQLKEIFSYENPAVFERYERDFPNHMSPKSAFREVVKYLWLSRKHTVDKCAQPNNESLKFTCSMYPEMREIDDMWHTFILFTVDYSKFCYKYFGTFMHHVPKTSGEKSLDPQAFEIEFTRYLSYVYDNLGKKTIECWFKEHI